MSMIGLRSDDRGATALIIALVMVLIMGIAAVVLDGGHAFSEKRQAQSGVDFASLAALAAAKGANPADSGAAEAQAVVAGNLPGRTLDWGMCSDAPPPEYSIISSITDCVSFTPNFSQARVVLPDDAVDTTFGAIMGIDEITVRTNAEAEQSITSSADIVPWTVGSGSNVCLFSNQAPQSVPPCDGPQSGFFGYLDVALYGNNQLDTPSTCEQGTPNVRSAVNVAKGSDHIMVEWNSGDPVVHDHTVCPNRSENINQLEVQTGSPTHGATDGLILGVSGSINGQAFGAADGRLEYNSEWSVSPPASVRGYNLDNTPLWTYLDDPSCPWAGGAITGNVDEFQEMVDCLDSWSTSEGSIFSLDLQDHLRFAAVPVFTVYPSGPGSYLIDFFSPVWIETIYQNCNADRCRTIFSPGETGGGTACPDDLAAIPTVNCGHSHTSGTDSVEGVTAFQMQVEMLHEDTQAFFPGSATIRAIHLLR